MTGSQLKFLNSLYLFTCKLLRLVPQEQRQELEDEFDSIKRQIIDENIKGLRKNNSANVDVNDRAILVHADGYALSKIVEGDRGDYYELHRQLFGEDMFFLYPHSADIIWELVLSGSNEYAILDSERRFCGTIQLKRIEERTPEIVLSILEEFRNRGIAKIAVKLLTELTYDPKTMDYYVVRIKSDNSHSIHVFEKMGAEYIGDDVNPLESILETVFNKHNSEELFNELRRDHPELFEEDTTIRRYKLEPGRTYV